MKALLHIFRLLRAGHIIAKYRIIPDAVQQDMPFAAKSALFILAPFAVKTGAIDERMGLALTKLGPSYIKFGQFLATRPDLVGEAIAGSLKQLQDDVPPFEHDIAVGQVEAAFGAKIDDVFKEFSLPIAAASIAQVHKATLKDGRIVAVKILRPDVEKKFARDLSDFFFIARIAEKLDEQARRLRLVKVVETLKKSVDAEMNLQLEAAAISEMNDAKNKFEGADFIVPDVDWTLTKKNILTTNWIDGVALSNMNKIRELKLDMPLLARDIVICFLTQALEFGVFHADMHPGNIFIKPNGQIALVDFGIIDRISKDERRVLAEILYAFIRRDYLHNAEVHFAAGYVSADYNVEDFALALRAIGEPMLGQGAQDVSMGSLLGQLLKTTETFGMQTQLQLVMLQKSLVIVEGVARIIDPKFDMFKAIEPLLEAWLKKTIGMEAKVKDTLDSVVELVEYLPKLPKLVAGMAQNVQKLEDIAKADTIMAQSAKVTQRHTRIQTGVLVLAVTGFLIAIFT